MATCLGKEVVGTIGVFGPTRMDYAKRLPLWSRLSVIRKIIARATRSRLMAKKKRIWSMPKNNV